MECSENKDIETIQVGETIVFYYPSSFIEGDILNFYGKRFEVIDLLDNNMTMLKRIY